MIRRLRERLRFRRDHRWTQAHASDYLDLDLDGRERERLEHHARICPECHRVLATLGRMLQSLRGLGSADPAPADAGTGGAVAEGVIEHLHIEG